MRTPKGNEVEYHDQAYEISFIDPKARTFACHSTKRIIILEDETIVENYSGDSPNVSIITAFDRKNNIVCYYATIIYNDRIHITITEVGDCPFSSYQEALIYVSGIGGLQFINSLYNTGKLIGKRDYEYSLKTEFKNLKSLIGILSII